MYQASRGIHVAGLSDGEQLLLLAEDVGRRNALDKILGEALMKGLRTEGRLLLTTGRISSEMLRKAAFMEAMVKVIPMPLVGVAGDDAGRFCPPGAFAPFVEH